MPKVRVQKYLAAQVFSSRRRVEQGIRAGGYLLMAKLLN